MILDEFPSGVSVTGQKDVGTTGNFEIKIDGELVHSKRTRGDGFLHTNISSQAKVFDVIRAALDGGCKK